MERGLKPELELGLSVPEVYTAIKHPHLAHVSRLGLQVYKIAVSAFALESSPSLNVYTEHV